MKNTILLVLFLINSPNHYIRAEKLSECKRCKVLTDSFNHWYRKTSRGKFEGGDAAWEEKKQKSYARSEVRLVEVQEGLCSELNKHQDDCYGLAEEVEQPIEQWWFREDPGAVDLYTSLCIETLKYCCPKSHFGESCDPCPVDANNEVCGGRGKCDGDGTRRGKGTCFCTKGFTGKYCDECRKNFYENSGTCEPCHESCDGCKGSGANNCHNCKSGWKLEDAYCVDVNECADAGICETDQFCVNSPGSFTCKACDNSCSSCVGAGASNCVLCADGYTLWNGNCLDNYSKERLLNSALQRATLYFVFLLMALVVSRTSKVLASLTVVTLAVFIYFTEHSNSLGTADILINSYFR